MFKAIIVGLTLAAISSLRCEAQVEQPCGSFSDRLAVVRVPPQQEAGASKLRVGIMDSRLAYLNWSVAGFERTGVPLVGWDGHKLLPSAMGDDVGLDYFVPKVSRLFHASVAASVSIFIVALLAISIVVGLFGFRLILNTAQGWLAAIAGVFGLAALALWVGDVYSVQVAAAIAATPWLVWLTCQRHTIHTELVGYTLIGAGLGVANVLRSHSGTVVLLFATILILFSARRIAIKKPGALICMLLGVVSSSVFFHSVVQRRDLYLQNAVRGYVSPVPQHPFWHTAYIGLGFLSNPYVPGGYCDDVAIDAVAKINPTAGFLSPQYDEVLRNKIGNLIREHPKFIAVTIAAKFGVIFIVALLAGNIGWFAILRSHMRLGPKAAFASAAAAGSAFGFVAIPTLPYLLSMVAFVVLLAIMSTESRFQVRLQFGSNVNTKMSQTNERVCAV